MAHLIVWGSTREIIAGELSGITPEEVTSLEGLAAILDGRAPALVLVDPARLAAERDATEAWLRTGGVTRAILVVVAADVAEGDEVLRRFPFVDDLLVRPLTPSRLRHRLERAFEAVQNRRVIRQLEKQVSRKGDELSELNKIGIALSAERDIKKLLGLILSKSREITGADAGSLYLVERAKESGNGSPDLLRFKLPQNDSVVVPFTESTMPLDESSIAGYVACTRKAVNVPDAYCLPEGSPYHISRSFDEKSGYRTKSMLVVPMCDHDKRVIGVVQLINKKRDRGAVLQPVSVAEEEVIAFTSVDEDLAESLASQAAVAIENADLIERVKKLFEEFVLAAVSAVEQRDLPTSGHSRRVAELTVELAKTVDGVSSGPLAAVKLGPEQLQELKYAALLHDFGKVAVQEKVLGKRKKLYGSRMVAVRQRFAYILKAREADYLRERLERVSSGRASKEELTLLEAEYRLQRAETERLLQAVLQANEPTVVEQESFAVLASLPEPRRFADHEDEAVFPVEDWAQQPYLSAAEVEALSIRRGTLTDDEWVQMRSHVSHTYEFLKKIPWTGELSRVPEIAWAHHEKLDGTGYPQGLKGKDSIPVQSRMMTISDIYDALVALDRPYKHAVSPERALEILNDEARRGQLDTQLLRVFVEAKIYDLPAFKALIRPRT
jgi:HD-GYP domain-containing protein (c-di-GMP phosphodiesterase class II)